MEKVAIVAIDDTPEMICRKFVNIRNEIDVAERQLSNLKPVIMKLVPESQTAEDVPALRHGTQGKYRITIVTRDSRKIDEAMMINLLEGKGLTAEGCSLKPDDDKIAKLVEEGKLKLKDIEKCLKGPITKYPTVKFLEME